MVNKLPIPNEKNGRAIMYIQGFPGINKKYNIIYPRIDILWVSINAFFLPIFLDNHATTGITIKVVPKAPRHPNKDTQIPEASASPLKSLYTITKNVREDTAINALYIKNVAPHNCLNSLILNASIKLS